MNAHVVEDQEEVGRREAVEGVSNAGSARPGIDAVLKLSASQR